MNFVVTSAPEDRKAFRPLPTIGVILGALATAFVLGMGSLLLCIALGLAPTLHFTGGRLHIDGTAALNAHIQLIVNIIADLGLLGFLAIFTPIIARRSLKRLGVRMPTWNDIGIGIIGAIAMWTVIELVAVTLQAITHREATEAAMSLLRALHTPAEKLEFITIAVLVAPLTEEFAFRVLLYNAFKRYMSFGWAAALSGLCFGVVHATSTTELLLLSIPLACGGAILAYVYARTGCYWANVTTHALFNSISVIAVFVFHVKA